MSVAEPDYDGQPSMSLKVAARISNTQHVDGGGECVEECRYLLPSDPRVRLKSRISSTCSSLRPTLTPHARKLRSTSGLCTCTVVHWTFTNYNDACFNLLLQRSHHFRHPHLLTLLKKAA
jgi:hypothetical protein